MHIPTMKWPLLIASLLTAMLMALPTYGAGVEILSDDAAAKADVKTLKTEASLFEKIKNGVMLSLAACDSVKNCNPHVNTDEIHRILIKLDDRITSLSTRYSKTKEKGLVQVLLTYADARKGYAKALDKIDALSEQDVGTVGSDINNDTGEATSSGSDNTNSQSNDDGDNL
jgi:hypothetical protein